MRRSASFAIGITGVLVLTMLLPVLAESGGKEGSPIFGVTVPGGYRQWEVIAPSHRPDKDEIRVILGNDIAMKAYRAGTLPFPDGSILAKLAWKRVKSVEFEEAFVPGEPQRIEFMVKDAKKYGSTGGGDSDGS